MCFDFVAIDFETSNSNMSSACSIGLVAIKNNEIAETFYSLIKPNVVNFDDDNVKINGITEADVKDAPSFVEVWKKINKYFVNNIIVAHNAFFDMSVLKDCLIENDLDIPDFDYVDSIPFSTCACDGNIGRSLETRAEYFGVELGNHHNGLSDATVCANLVLACLNAKKIENVATYCSRFDNISIKNFTELNPQKNFVKNRSKQSNVQNLRHNKVCISEIACTTTDLNTEHPFYNKSIVFTGDLEYMDRKTAMQKAVDHGAILKSGVSSKTDYLIVGKQDKSIVGEDGMSSKEEKAYELNKNGKDIKILNEIEFLRLIQ